MENPQTQIPTPEVVPQTDLHLSQEDISKKKKSFFRNVKRGLTIFGISIIVITVLVIVKNIYTEKKDRFVVNPDTPSETGPNVVIVKPDEEIADTWKSYENPQYRFSFNYPVDANVAVTDEPGQPLSVRASAQNTIPTENADGFNLIKGYFFEVKPVNIAARDIEKVTEVKKDWFEENCPKTAQISPIQGITLSNIGGLGFTVTNCNSDFSVNYIAANNLIFEVIQTYKGDLGFKQNYKLQTNLILNSFKINEIQPTLDPLIKYHGQKLGMDFYYPRELDTTCCEVPEPPMNDTYHMLTMSTGTDKSSVGFYFKYSDPKADFLPIVDELENTLIDDYKVIKSRTPDGTKTKLNIAGMEAYEFKNYSWKGNNIIIARLPTNGALLLLSYTEFPRDLLDQIINSFEPTQY